MITRAIAITKHAHNKYLINPPKKSSPIGLHGHPNYKCFLHFQAIYSQNENAKCAYVKKQKQKKTHTHTHARMHRKCDMPQMAHFQTQH